MQINEQLMIDAPADRVWPIISDPVQIAACFPGAELDDATEDEAYHGRIAVRFGPTRATFNGQASFEFDHDGHRGTIVAQGRDRRGSTRASTHADVRLLVDDRSAQRSVVTITGELELTGPLSGFAEAGGVHVARLLFADFGVQVAERAKAEVSASAGPRPSAAIGSPRPPGGIASSAVPDVASPPPPASNAPRRAEQSLSGFVVLRRLVGQWLRARLCRRSGRRV
jgi:carbon monoxide dehydrogenase subunit G